MRLKTLDLKLKTPSFKRNEALFLSNVLCLRSVVFTAFATLILIFSLPSAAHAEVFQGEVTVIDRTQDSVTIQSRAQNGRVIEQRVFHVQPGYFTDRFDMLDVEVGEEIQVNASNRNGVWEVESLLANPLPDRGAVRVSNPNAPGTRADAVLVTSGISPPHQPAESMASLQPVDANGNAIVHRPESGAENV